MRKIAAVVVATLAAAAATGLHGRPAAAGEAGYENYVVRPGDTLSGISARVLGKSGRWRELLRENPQVKNADVIYPGDTLRVPVPEPVAAEGLEARPAPAAEETAAAAEPAEAVAETAAETELDAEAAAIAAGLAPPPGLPVEVVRSVPVVNPGLYRSAGYIDERLPSVAIVATEESRLVLGPGDTAFLNVPVEVGTRFTVVRADRRIFHPVTAAPLGWLFRVLGTAETTCRNERTSCVELQPLRDAVTVGDYLVPPIPEREAPRLRPKGAARTVAPGPPDAVIVAFDEDRLSASEQELAYIDRGRSGGVEPGTRFQVYRPVPPGVDVMVGELQVLKAGEETATALVTTSLREIQIADRLRAER